MILFEPFKDTKLSLLGPNADDTVRPSIDVSCSPSMDSSKSNPLQDENLASIRRKNTLLIAVLFSLMISLSLIIGGFIIYLTFEDNFKPQSAITNPAVNHFCSVAESQLSCIVSLSSSDIKPILFTDPIHVYTLSLESAVAQLSRVDSILSTSDSIDTAIKNCSTSLRVATGRIDRALAVMRVDPDNETRVFEEKGGLVELIVEAMEELRSCGEDLKERSESSTAVGEAGTRVHEIELLLRYSRDYLLKCEFVNRRFSFQTIIHDHEKMSRSPFLGILAKSSVFGLQYFVLVFLFTLILLRCNFCYIGGSGRRVVPSARVEPPVDLVIDSRP